MRLSATHCLSTLLALLAGGCSDQQAQVAPMHKSANGTGELDKQGNFSSVKDASVNSNSNNNGNSNNNNNNNGNNNGNNNNGNSNGSNNSNNNSSDATPIRATDVGANVSGGSGNAPAVVDTNHLTAVSSVAQAAIKYPTYRLNGAGTTYCSSDNGPYGITTNVVSSFAADKLETTRNNTVVNCGDDSDCSDHSNNADQAAKSNTNSTFIRSTEQDLQTLKAANASYYDPVFAFAKSASYKDQEPGDWEYVFDPQTPLPVTPWAADSNRYTNFTSKTWQVHASGTYPSVNITVTASKVSQDAHKVVITMTTTIDLGETGNWAYYRVFPSAYQQTFTIDTDKQAIVQIQTVGRHDGDKHCDDQTHTDFTMTACDMNVGGVVSALGCSYSGQ